MASSSRSRDDMADIPTYIPSDINASFPMETLQVADQWRPGWSKVLFFNDFILWARGAGRVAMKTCRKNDTVFTKKNTDLPKVKKSLDR